MGNSGSYCFTTPTPKKVSWARQEEDTSKLEDALPQPEQAKKKSSVEKIDLTRSIRYMDLQQSDSSFPALDEMYFCRSLTNDHICYE